MSAGAAPVLGLREMYALLRRWAKGSQPCMAAVEFLIAVETLYPDHPMVGVERDERGLAVRARLELFDLDDDEWLDRIGTMSGGEQATWMLARSLVAGELEEWFWRMDRHRKLAFVRAMEMYAG